MAGGEKRGAVKRFPAHIERQGLGGRVEFDMTGKPRTGGDRMMTIVLLNKKTGVRTHIVIAAQTGRIRWETYE